MAYSIHGHISYIAEANSKRPNAFSLIGRNQMKFCNLSEKDIHIFFYNKTIFLPEPQFS